MSLAEFQSCPRLRETSKKTGETFVNYTDQITLIVERDGTAFFERMEEDGENYWSQTFEDEASADDAWCSELIVWE